MTYYSGGVYDREVVNWIAGTGFDLKLTKYGKQASLAVWRITPIDDESRKLRITVHSEDTEMTFPTTR